MYKPDRFDDLVSIPVVQQSLFAPEEVDIALPEGSYKVAKKLDDLDTYDRYVVAHSTGKDSMASLLRLKELGVDFSKVELHHHCIDGEPGSAAFQDWPFVESLMKQIGEMFNIPVYFSWLHGGFKGEMLKSDAISQPISFETPDGITTVGRSKQAKPNTRMKFPQVGPMRTRWCTSALKIDVSNRQLTGDPRFLNSKTLFITGERAEESNFRKGMLQLTRHSAYANKRIKREVHHWRAIHHFTEEDVYAILERHRIEASLVYHLGWNRSSCRGCIYSNDSVWATLAEYFPEFAQEVDDYEKQFGISIARDKVTVLERAKRAKPIDNIPPELVKLATQTDYTLPIQTPKGQDWQLPMGAFKNSFAAGL